MIWRQYSKCKHMELARLDERFYHSSTVSMIFWLNKNFLCKDHLMLDTSCQPSELNTFAAMARIAGKAEKRLD